MVLNTTQQSLIKIASVLGIIQSLGWIIMSLIAIILYFQDDYLDVYSIYSYEDFNNFLLRLLYIRKTSYLYYNGYYLSDLLNLDDFIIDPVAFNVFMFINFFSNLTWLFISVIIFKTIRKMDFKNLEKQLLAWTLATVGISTIDFVFVCCLGRDYSKCTFFFCEPIGLVLTLAAKGFVLWFVNVIFAVVLRMYSVEIRRARINPAFYQNIAQVQNAPLYQIPQGTNGFNAPAYVQFYPSYVQNPPQTIVPVFQQGILQQSIPQSMSVPQTISVPQAMPVQQPQPPMNNTESPQ